MPKFRKKPVVIEAEVYRSGLEDGFENGKPYIQTLEGRHYITPGDYIVTGVKGERYPVKPDIFEATYEPVAEHEAKPRYTQGPWTVTGGGVLIYSRPAKQEVGYAREVYRCRAEREANARLMAAAPELLEAAEAAMRRLKQLCAACNYAPIADLHMCVLATCETHQVLEQLEAAIAKAVGWAG